MSGQFPRPRLPLESREVQFTIRMPPELKAEIDHLCTELACYRYQNDFFLDLIFAGLPHAREAVEKLRKDRNGR